jgi:hypothetical protein
MGLDQEKLKSIGKGAALAGLGALLAYLTTAAAGGEFGTWGPVLTVVFSVAANAVRKYLADPEVPPQPPEDV